MALNMKRPKGDRYKPLTPLERLTREREVYLQAQSCALRVLFWSSQIDTYVNKVYLYLKDHPEIKLQALLAECKDLKNDNGRVMVQCRLLERRFFTKVYGFNALSKAGKYPNVGDFAQLLHHHITKELAYELLDYQNKVEAMVEHYATGMNDLVSWLYQIQGFAVYASANIGILKEYAKDLRVTPECLRDFDMLLYRHVLDCAYRAVIGTRACPDIDSNDKFQTACNEQLKKINIALVGDRVENLTDSLLLVQMKEYLYWYVADEVKRVIDGDGISEDFKKEVSAVMGEFVTFKETMTGFFFDIATNDIDNIIYEIKKNDKVTEFVESAVEKTKEIITTKKEQPCK